MTQGIFMPAYIAGGISSLEYRVVAGSGYGGSVTGYNTISDAGPIIGTAPIAVSHGIPLESCMNWAGDDMEIDLTGNVVSVVKDFVVFINGTQRNIKSPVGSNTWKYYSEYGTTTAFFNEFVFTSGVTYNIVLRKP